MATNKAPITWSIVCMAIECGRLDIKDFILSNQEAIFKKLWAIESKKIRCDQDGYMHIISGTNLS